MICLWCYVGKRRQLKYLATSWRRDVRVRCLRFQCNSQMPQEGIEYMIPLSIAPYSSAEAGSFSTLKYGKDPIGIMRSRWPP